jgi:cyclohexadieny/prephenate dehydrogenase
VKPVERVAIVGLGLMGGSLARALAARDVYVLGYDRRADTVDAALRTGIVREPLDIKSGAPIDADVLVLATPVDAVIAALPALAPLTVNVRLVMDVASTKGSIVNAAQRAGMGERFIGAHPLTGSHRSGWYASRASMFDDARVFLSPTSESQPDALALAEAFWRGLRAGVEIIDANVHDVQMAWRSHLPHMVSSALALVLDGARIERSALGPGGRDMTRLAGGAASMWTPIAEDNQAALVTALESFEAQLASLKQAIRDGRTTDIAALLARGSAWFDGGLA